MTRALAALLALTVAFTFTVVEHPHRASAAFTAACTGGTITTSGGNTIHTFTSSGTLDCTGAGGTQTANVLVVGGGGGGGGGSGSGARGGGGGAGGYRTDAAF